MGVKSDTQSKTATWHPEPRSTAENPNEQNHLQAAKAELGYARLS